MQYLNDPTEFRSRKILDICYNSRSSQLCMCLIMVFLRIATVLIVIQLRLHVYCLILGEKKIVVSVTFFFLYKLHDTNL